ncbi:MAG: DNA polymerase I, thermostable [Mycoplasmataceae bacterium]|nr:MAG: DNA polymerase I, thermostable [Mycoplasmataceae bacterium]
MKSKGLIVDGNNLLHSSYHVAQKATWKINNGTIFFFLRVLISIFKKENYQNLLIVFDGGGSNFRKNLLDSYKEQRTEMPQDLWEQMKILKKLLEESNIALIQMINHEADDLIASFINQLTKENCPASLDIFTRDKDLLQLLDKKVSILKYIEGKSKIYTYENFCQDYGFSPSNYVDYLSLLGDNADNIKGVNGIGPVNAKKLIQQFGTIENIFQKIEELSEKTKKILENQEGIAHLNKRIIKLDKNIAFLPEEIKNWDFRWESWKSNKKLREFCEKNQFNSILKSFD